MDVDIGRKIAFIPRLPSRFLSPLAACCPLFPFAIAFFYAESSLWIPLFLAGAIGSTAVFFLLRLLERRMRQTVGRLVQARIERMQGGAQQQEVCALRQRIEEMGRGYEHQIDLLHAAVFKSKEEAEEILRELSKKEAELSLISQEYNKLKEEQVGSRESLFEEIKRKDLHITDYQHTITEQRVIIEKKQRYITKLESKVRDLMYEIRSLLQLEEAPPPLPFTSAPFVEMQEKALRIETPYIAAPVMGAVPTYDLSVQLQRYVEAAEHFTGADHLAYVGGKAPRFLDISRDSYAIDLRRLFDLFREEATGILFLYSLGEEKFLFVGNLVKTLLGWSPEKFMKDFPQLLTHGYTEWRQGLTKLPSLRETKLQIALRNKSGDELLFQCFLGLIAKGPFSHHVIGILSPLE